MKYQLFSFFQLTSVDLFFMRVLDQLLEAKSIKVLFGKVQNLGDIKPEVAISEQLDEGDEMTDAGTEYTGEWIDPVMKDKTKTYIVEGEEETDLSIKDVSDKGDDDRNLDDEVETLTGRSSKGQIPVYAESTGTLTPDI